MLPRAISNLTPVYKQSAKRLNPTAASEFAMRVIFKFKIFPLLFILNETVMNIQAK